jgi:hypothetical protein
MSLWMPRCVANVLLLSNATRGGLRLSLNTGSCLHSDLLPRMHVYTCSNGDLSELSSHTLVLPHNSRGLGGINVHRMRAHPIR